MKTEKVTFSALAYGGAAVGRLADGRVCFVRGVLPGETAEIRIAAEKSAVLPALAAAAITGLPVTVDLENVDDRLWEEKLNYQPLIGKIGKLAGLLYLNLRPECRFVHPGKFQSIVDNNNSKYTSFADAL